MTKMSNWRASGKQQEKSEQTPKAARKKKRQLSRMMQKLKRESKPSFLLTSGI